MTRLLFASESRFMRGKDGYVYSGAGEFTNQLMERYLQVFQTISVIARVDETEPGEHPENLRLGSDVVSVLPLPYYVGPWQYLKQKNKITRTIKSYVDQIQPDDVCLCRLPGTVGTMFAEELIRKNIPYGIEVVGDPHEVFSSNGGVKTILRGYLRYQMTKTMKRIVANAATVLYVTKQQLQKQYPASPHAFTTHASDVVLKENAFVSAPKRWVGQRPIHLLSIGFLEVMYKAPDVVLQAMSLLWSKGIECRLTWIGEGKCREQMIQLTDSLNLTDYVDFVGKVTAGEKVRKYLDQADIYLMASRTEGLPRALVEAMARGLPCIGTRVGGIPELLDDSALILVNDPHALAEKIISFVSNPEYADAMAKRNLEVAHEYEDGILNQHRIDFYRHVQEARK